MQNAYLLAATFVEVADKTVQLLNGDSHDRSDGEMAGKLKTSLRMRGLAKGWPVSDGGRD